MSLFKNTIQKETSTRRAFSYMKNKCNLSFTLRTDIKQELLDFKEILSEAIKDIEEQLKQK